MRGYANEEQWLSARRDWVLPVSRRDADAYFAHPFLLESLIMIVIRVALIHHCRKRRREGHRDSQLKKKAMTGTEANQWKQKIQCNGLCTKKPSPSVLSSTWMSQFPFESIKGQVYIALCQHKVEHLFQLNSASATSRLELAYLGFANAIRANARLQRHWKAAAATASVEWDNSRQGYLFKLI